MEFCLDPDLEINLLLYRNGHPWEKLHMHSDLAFMT